MKMIILAVGGGVAVTLLTGLFDNTPPMWVGATLFGYPFAWLVRMVIAPQYNPWTFNPVELVEDIVMWTVLVWIILFAISRSKKNP